MAHDTRCRYFFSAANETTGWTNGQAQEQLVVLEGVAAEKDKAEESAKKAKAEAAKAIEGMFSVQLIS